MSSETTRGRGRQGARCPRSYLDDWTRLNHERPELMENLTEPHVGLLVAEGFLWGV